MKPDFSGEYVLDRAGSTLVGEDREFDSGVILIEHVEPVFRYKTRLTCPRKKLQYGGVRYTDNREDEFGDDEVRRAHWDGDVLVAEERIRRPFPGMTTTFRYELIDNGQRLRITEQTTRLSAGPENVWLFQRR